jgi:hypothetical protein
MSSRTRTPHLEEILLGGCYLRDVTGDISDCPSVIENITNIFAPEVDEYSIVTEDYGYYFSVANFTTPKDKAMFWSGGGFINSAFTNDGSRFVRLEDTPGGAILTGISFCAAEDGANCTRLPNSGFDQELNNGMGGHRGTGAYWAGASWTFAAGVTGVARALLYARDGQPAYRDTSFFARYEVPALNPSAVTDFEIYVVNNIGSASIETCESDSLVVLTQKLEAHGMRNVICFDNHWEIQTLLCFENINDPSCAFLSTLGAGLQAEIQGLEKDKDQLTSLTISGWVLFGAILIGLVIVLFLCNPVRGVFTKKVQREELEQTSEQEPEQSEQELSA